MSESMGKIQARNLSNATIQAIPQQLHYLTTESVVINQKAADIR
jgi:hypothetical protein